MNGVRIKIFYGNRYYDTEYDIEKWDYDYEIIGNTPTEQQHPFNALQAKLRRLLGP